MMKLTSCKDIENVNSGSQEHKGLICFRTNHAQIHKSTLLLSIISLQWTKNSFKNAEKLLCISYITNFLRSGQDV